MNAFDPALFAASIGCLPCCEAPPEECACALLLPVGSFPTIPFANITDASDAIEDFTADCLVFAQVFADSPANLGALSADDSTPDTLILAGQGLGPGAGLVLPELAMYSSLNLKAGSTLTIDFSYSATGGAGFQLAAFTLYTCLGAEVDSGVDTTNFTGTWTVSIPADGVYVLELGFLGHPDGTAVTSTVTNSSDDTMTANPIIALWDDSGTTRQLWACPKLLLPPLTESTGDWYADETEAQAAIDDYTSNCVGYIESLTNITTFTATDGGTSLTLAAVLTVGATSAPAMWGGVNAVGGQTITITATAGTGTPSLSAFIYDDTGTLVEASGSVASPWVSSALPYTGRYTIKVTTSSTLATVALAAAITSSGALSVNQVQARYDIGLECSANLDC